MLDRGEQRDARAKVLLAPVFELGVPELEVALGRRAERGRDHVAAFGRPVDGVARLAVKRLCNRADERAMLPRLRAHGDALNSRKSPFFGSMPWKLSVVLIVVPGVGP